MPKVNSETDPWALNRMRGVRVGDEIFYGESPFTTHKNLALDEAGVEEFVGDRPKVDDAGFFRIIDEKLILDDGSTSTFIKPAEDARNETNRILSGIKFQKSS